MPKFQFDQTEIDKLGCNGSQIVNSTLETKTAAILTLSDPKKNKHLMEFLDSAYHLGKLLLFISQLRYLFRLLLQRH